MGGKQYDTMMVNGYIMIVIHYYYLITPVEPLNRARRKKEGQNKAKK